MATTIQVDESLKKRLDSLKIHRREIYNEILIRLINLSKSSPKLMKGFYITLS
jgi:hypothetical protein